MSGVHTSLLRLNLGDLRKSAWQAVGSNVTRKRIQVLSPSLTSTRESPFAVRIVLSVPEIISAIAWLITLIKTKTSLTHNFFCLLLWGTQWVNAITQRKASGRCLKFVRAGLQPPHGHISVYMIHIISGCTQNTTHIMVSLSDPSKALLK